MHTNANDSLHVSICLLRIKILEYTGNIDTMYIIWRDMMQLFLSPCRSSNIFFWWSMEAFCIQYKSYSCAISEILEKLSSQTYTQCTLIENVYNARGCDMTDCFIYFMYYLRDIFLREQYFWKHNCTFQLNKIAITCQKFELHILHVLLIYMVLGINVQHILLMHRICFYFR